MSKGCAAAALGFAVLLLLAGALLLALSGLAATALAAPLVAWLVWRMYRHSTRKW